MISVESQENRAQRNRCRLDTCCLFFSLRTGCRIISILSMCESLLYVIGLSRAIYHFSDAGVCSSEQNSTHRLSIEAIIEREPTCFTREEIGKHLPVTLMTTASFLLGLMAIFFLVSLLMSFGVRLGYHKLLYPWLWFKLGEMVVFFNSIPVSPGLFGMVVDIYFCVIVYSHIIELKEQRLSDDVVSYMHVRNGGLTSLQPRSYVVPGMSRGCDRSGRRGGAAAAGRGDLHVCLPPESAVMSPEEFAAKVDATRLLYGDQPPPYSPPLASYDAASSEAAGASGAVGGAGAATSSGSTAAAGATLPPPPSYTEAMNDPIATASDDSALILAAVPATSTASAVNSTAPNTTSISYIQEGAHISDNSSRVPNERTVGGGEYSVPSVQPRS